MSNKYANPTAERAIISLCCDDPAIFYEAERRGITEETFGCIQRQRIWRFMRAAHAAGKKPDRLMVASKVESSKSEACLAEFAEVPASGDVIKHHAPEYMAEIMRAWKRHRFDQLQAEAKAKMKTEEPDLVAHWMASELAQLESNTIEVKTIDSIAPMVEQGWEDALAGKQVGVPSCFKQVNGIIGCYRRKVVTGIGAMTNTGKSIYAKHEVLHCGIDLERPVALITPEDPDDMVVSSMVGIRHRTNTFALDMGLTRGNRDKGIDGLRRIKGHPIYIVDMPMTGEKLEATMTLLKAKYDVQMIVVDHLHYIREPSFRDEYSKYNHLMGIISGATKTLDVSTLMFAQLSRSSNRANKPPRLSDFKDTGNIENEIRTGGMMWVDPSTTYRVLHIEKCKGYASERRLCYFEARGDNIPGFDEVPKEKWPDDLTTLQPWKEEGKSAWTR